jgi:membrane-associated phospholipid phosphatase
MFAFTQTRIKNYNTGYEAAIWDTYFLDNVKAINIAPPPGKDISKLNYKSVKQAVAKADELKSKKIIYWNAGAPAYRWNQVGGKLISWNDPDLVLRFPTTWMNIAIYDATVLAWKEKMKYKRVRPNSADATLETLIPTPATYSYPCEHTVTASAAAHVLAYFYPAKKDSLLDLAKQASQSRIDAGVQYPSDAEAGWKLGEQVAQQIIERAKKDGSHIKWDGQMNTDPKKWTGTYPLGITKAKHAPLFMRSVDQFRPAPPPDFENEMTEMKNFQKNFCVKRSAYFWANTPFDFWFDIANKKIFEYRMEDDAPSVARIYAILGVSGYDAAIATMDAKYAYWGIRPSQYDTSYKPLITTPPFPGYPSGHALGAASHAAVLSYFFPEDAAYFQKLAEDCAESRFYAGIHFRTDNVVGLEMGKQIGNYILSNWLKNKMMSVKN